MIMNRHFVYLLGPSILLCSCVVAFALGGAKDSDTTSGILTLRTGEQLHFYETRVGAKVRIHYGGIKTDVPFVRLNRLLVSGGGGTYAPGERPESSWGHLVLYLKNGDSITAQGIILGGGGSDAIEIKVYDRATGSYIWNTFYRVRIKEIVFSQ